MPEPTTRTPSPDQAQRTPRGVKGHFVSRTCPLADCDGFLEWEDSEWGIGHWRCNGLIDPNDPSKELQACTYVHFDGEPTP